MTETLDVLIIGGGQAGLATAYFLRRTDLSYLILDDQDAPGGAWQNTWDSLRLFSPRDYSSIPGWRMPPSKQAYPEKDEFIAYLAAYEDRYQFPIQRPVRVETLRQNGDLLTVETSNGPYHARAIVSATGTAQAPVFPMYPGRSLFKGRQLHSVDYRNADDMSGETVLIVGGGNSGAQILAETSKVAKTLWVTLEEPTFLSDDIDGRYLFQAATERFHNSDGTQSTASLNNIVMVESVKEARSRNVLNSVRPFDRFDATGVIWPDGSHTDVDTVIWCTGFQANLSHLDGLGIVKNGRTATDGTRSQHVPGLWLVGYGGWTGYASATIYGVQKSARDTARQIEAYLS